MRKCYETPQLDIRKYSLSEVTYTVSTPEVGNGKDTPDLGDDDLFDPFA